MSAWRRGWRTRELAGLAIGVWLAIGWVAHGADLKLLERKIQARFLYNFAALTEWPTNAFTSTNSPLVLAVLGNDPYGPLLDEVLTNRLVSGRAVVVQHVRRGQDIGNCHILFISASESGRLPAVLKTLTGRSILTVADFPGFTDQGGMIEFVSSPKSEVSFRINNAAAHRAGLRISSHLLKLRLTEVVGPRVDSPGRYACPRSVTCPYAAS